MFLYIIACYYYNPFYCSKFYLLFFYIKVAYYYLLLRFIYLFQAVSIIAHYYLLLQLIYCAMMTMTDSWTMIRKFKRN